MKHDHQCRTNLARGRNMDLRRKVSGIRSESIEFGQTRRSDRRCVVQQALRGQAPDSLRNGWHECTPAIKAGMAVMLSNASGWNLLRCTINAAAKRIRARL